MLVLIVQRYKELKQAYIKFAGLESCFNTTFGLIIDNS